MLIQKALVLMDDFHFERADVRCENGLISEIGELYPSSGEAVTDADGRYLIPGLIDVHTHGYFGCSCASKDPDKQRRLSRALAKEGVTGYAAGLATMPEEHYRPSIEANLRAAKSFDESAPSGARLLGIHLEGPFLNREKKGAMRESCLQMPSVERLKAYIEAGEGLVKIMTIAPELPGAEEVIRYGVSHNVKMSMGHTNALRAEARLGADWGISRATHVFNAMRSLNHRESGVLGVSLTDDRIQCELIGDLVHVAPEVCLMVYRLKGAEKVTLISDSCELAGLTNEMLPEGLPYVIRDAAYLKDGTLCGSTCTVMTCMKNMVSLGIPLAEAVKMASLNPARDLSLDDKFGSITLGKAADLVLLSDDLSPEKVWIGGVPLSD